MTTFHEITVPAYFNTRIGMQRAANTLHVVGRAAADKHVAQISNQGGAPSVADMTEAAYKAAVAAKFKR